MLVLINKGIFLNNKDKTTLKVQNTPLIKGVNGNLFLVSNKKGKYGYINSKGKMVLSPIYDEAEDFSDGLAAVRIGKEEGFIDTAGKLVFNYNIKYAGEFHEGMALIWDVTHFEGSPIYTYGFINRKGKDVLEPKYNVNAMPFSEGFAAVACPEQPSLYQYIDKNGKDPFGKRYKFAGSFVNGLAAVCTSDNYLYGFINKTGELVIKPQFENKPQFCNVPTFNEGLALVSKELADGTSVQFCINKKGEKVFDIQFDEAHNFSEGVAAFYNSGWGYVDSLGKIVIKPKYFDAGDYREGLAAVGIFDDNSGLAKWGFINKKGVEVIKPQYEEVGDFLDGIAYFKKNKTSGYIDKTGKVIWVNGIN